MFPLPLASFAALLIAASALPAPIPPQQQLAYGLPSPPTATYEVVDTTGITITMSMGPMEGSGSSSFTFAATFEAEGAGTRVSGELTAFTGRSNSPMGGSTTLSEAAAGVQGIDLVLGPQGVGEGAQGALRRLGDLPIFAEPHEVMFPRLPEGEVRPGDSWMDTVTNVGADGDFERVAVNTYTLVGDTVVDGRPHLRVDISGDATLTMEPGPPGMTQSLGGTEVGFFLWDVARGLPVYAEVSRAYEGTMTIPGEGAMDIKASSATRMRLAN